jgi:hypothetical protein
MIWLAVRAWSDIDVDRCNAISGLDELDGCLHCGAPATQWLRTGKNLYCRCPDHAIDATGKPLIHRLTREEALVLSVQEA